MTGLATVTYTCPITECVWTHRDEGPEPLELGASSDETHAHRVLHQATVEHALRAHYETHDAEDWVRLVSQLKQELESRSTPLLCVACLSARYEAEQAGHAPPPQNAVQVIVGGDGLCIAHLQFGPPTPHLAGRTRGGLIIGNPIPPTGV